MVGFGRGLRGHGGGIYSRGSAPSIIGCTISDNKASASGGGGEFAHNWMTVPQPRIESCFITNNSVLSLPYGYGGGITCFHSNPQILNCEIVKNHVKIARLPDPQSFGFIGGGGGIAAILNSDLSLINCTIAGNHADTNGGGLLVFFSTADMWNNIIWGNTVKTGMQGNQIYIPRELSTVSLHYCDFANGPDDVQGLGTVIEDANCIHEDPQFVVSGFKITSPSPCIDAGQTDIAVNSRLTTDVFGNPRVTGPEVDIGSYEYHPAFRAVIVGVSSYEYEYYSPPVHYLPPRTGAGNSARSLAARLKNQDTRWEQGDVTLLTSTSRPQATKENIRIAIKKMLDAAGGEDTLLFYFSGHGDKVGTNYLLYPYDGRYWDGTTTRPNDNIYKDDLTTWFSYSPAEKFLVILDSCHSGGMWDVMNYGHIIMSAEEDERAYEKTVGARYAEFTYYFEQAIKDNATDTMDDQGQPIPNGQISAEEAFQASKDKPANQNPIDYNRYGHLEFVKAR